MMKYYKEFKGITPNIVGKKKKVDNNIYTFDIETTNYLLLDGRVIPSCNYLDLTKDEQERCDYRSFMYIWMFGINDTVYYGRTWHDLDVFLFWLDYYVKCKKIVFIHNLGFEFNYLKSVFRFKNVLARKAHKVMKCEMEKYNIELRCTYMMSNCGLKLLPKVFMLPVEKKVGDLDYDLIRTPITELTEKEMGYCEYDCLVVYYYIKKELEDYLQVDKIPLTSTGHVRRELKTRIENDYNYKYKVKKSINIDPHVYNLLQYAFMGGYTHANYLYTDEIVKNVDSWDFTSSYPYVLVTHKYPSSEFKKCNINKRTDMTTRFAYLITVKFYDIECKYYNTFISMSKCSEIKQGVYDNGRVMKAKELKITLTDIDFYFILDTHKYSNYKIIESYYSIYDFLPKTFINFVLEKYVNKTKLKSVEGKEVEYAKEKNKFNSLYGMSVTNMIRDEVIYDNESDWLEKELTNDEIIEKLKEEKKKAFLSFSYGVWVTAYARNNLLRNVIKLDTHAIYMDTDSIKCKEGYDIKVIEDYNKYVEKRINKVSKILDIDINKFAPKDNKGNSRMLGVFDSDGNYDEFITQGAKKYAYTKWIDKKKIKEDTNVLEIKKDKAKVLEITVARCTKKWCVRFT